VTRLLWLNVLEAQEMLTEVRHELLRLSAALPHNPRQPEDVEELEDCPY
jgi:hypothetical protein